ncbi:hypothetical protein CDL12_02768 [Handroanthus impetiginosus]|uniref:F-box domain-containing protein n=1 Tax=Handroanthus impetiginosus TaxID=429701 RepID=A0A2G9I424_9LAMI|nr:hypothetical protein CDL12_02768 [Handroanthus impetiginosus]
MENPIHSNLPQELILEITLRLPTKTLLRFKCVSTEWNTLIRSPNFAKQHFSHKSNQELLLAQRYNFYKEKYTLVLFIDDSLSQYDEPDHLQIPGTQIIMGPLNGVFCVEFGFGLNSFGDYKLVYIQYLWDNESDGPYYPCIISVYNSGSDSWRHFEETDFVNYERSVYKSLVNTYLNEVYYWLMVHVDNPPSIACILAFDMRQDKFREIKGPNGIRTVDVYLGLYGDSVALLSDEKHKFVDVWVMESEGHWSRIFKVGPIEDICWPLGFWKNNALLFETSTTNELSMYNVRTKALRTFEDHEAGRYLFGVFIYKESLVSIKGEGDNCYMWDTSSDVLMDFFRRQLRNR